MCIRLRQEEAHTHYAHMHPLLDITRLQPKLVCGDIFI